MSSQRMSIRELYPQGGVGTRPALPPLSRETAIQKIRLPEDRWDARDPEKITLPHTSDSRWRSYAFSSERPPIPPQVALASGVLTQAVHDLRRFHGATHRVRPKLYLDAFIWLTTNDSSWPYSFVNVCKLLHVSPGRIRSELLVDVFAPPDRFQSCCGSDLEG